MENNNTKKKIAVGLSGGVDSSVAAHLLKEQGHDVTGVFMQCWDAKADGCRADEDRDDAVKVANKLGIKFASLDFIDAYKSKVIDYFYEEYKAGRTPNPDVLCNKEIKFGLFLGWALKEGFDYVATGHYSKVIEKDGKFELHKGADDSKDQSYFLYLLGQKELSKTIFPLGEITKSDVRKIAKEIGLHTYDKRDSVGICFIGEVDIKDFLSKRIKMHKGVVVDTKGKVMGTHDGAEFYTIGQRHGFEINKYVGLPLYVVDKNVEKNELIVGFAGDANKDSFIVTDSHWVSGKEPDFPLECDVRIRHLGELFEATVDKKKNSLEVKLHDPIFGVAPGQSAVFYANSKLLGGGVIN